LGNTAFAQIRHLDVEWHGRIVDTDSLTISADGRNVTIMPSGLIRGTIDNHKVEFTLPVEEGYHVASANWVETDSLHIIFYEESIGTHGGTSFVIVDKENYTISKKESAGGFNFGQPLIKDRYLYLRSIGTVGKYDLRKRAYAWEHRNLYDRQRGTFNIIEEPEFKDGKVVFVSLNKGEGIVDTLIIEDSSGIILNKQGFR
jgi:hypothetical protein